MEINLTNLTEKQSQVYDLYVQGLSTRKIADKLNIAKSTVGDHLKKARKKVEMAESPGLIEGLNNSGIDIGIFQHGWVKGENGSWFVKPSDFGQLDQTTMEEIIQGAFETSVPRVSPTTRQTQYVEQDLLTKYVLADLHMGMYAWAKESGEDYDINIAENTLMASMDRLIQSTPNSATALLLNLGDTFHANDRSGMTPASGNILDMDTRFVKIAVTVIRVLRYTLETLAEKHEKVVYAAVPGNHDPDQSMWLTLALIEAYRDDPRIEIVWNPSAWVSYRHGKNLFVAHHGDKVNFQRLVLAMAENYSIDWGETYWRFLDTGHVHHQREQEIGGVLCRSYRTISAKDEYHTKNAYVSKRSITAQTYHVDQGEILVNNVHLFNGMPA